MEKDIRLSSNTSIINTPEQMIRDVENAEKNLKIASESLTSYIIENKLISDISDEIILQLSELNLYNNQKEREQLAAKTQKELNKKLPKSERSVITKNSNPDTISPKIKWLKTFKSNIRENIIVQDDLKFLVTYSSNTLTTHTNFIDLANNYIEKIQIRESAIQSIEKKLKRVKKDNKKLTKEVSWLNILSQKNDEELLRWEMEIVLYIRNIPSGKYDLKVLVDTWTPKEVVLFDVNEKDLDEVLKTHEDVADRMFHSQEVSIKEKEVFFALSKELHGIFDENSTQTEESKILEQNMLKTNMLLKSNIANYNELILSNDDVIKQLEDFLAKEWYDWEFEISSSLINKMSKTLKIYTSIPTEQLKETLNFSTESLGVKAKEIVSNSSNQLIEVVKENNKISILIAIILFSLLVKYHIWNIYNGDDKTNDADKHEIKSSQTNHNNDDTKHITSRN